MQVFAAQPGLVGTQDKILKVAVTFLVWVIGTTQAPVPEHPSPDQLLKVEPEAGEAVKVTEVPEV